MAINRAPWTALVDDDGTGKTGSIWNKAAIAGTLLDPIDALVGGWNDIPFDPAMFSASTGTWVPNAAAFVTCRYALINKLIAIQLDISAGAHTISASPIFLYVTMPLAVPPTANQFGLPFSYYLPGAVGTGVLQMTAGQRKIELLRDIAGTAWPAQAATGCFFRANFFYGFV